MSRNEADITVVSAAAAIRSRADMYLDLHDPALPARLVLQSLCHAIDEAMDGRCSAASLRVAPDGLIEVRYDAGMPLQDDEFAPGQPVALSLFRVLLACHSRKKHIEVGAELCEIGLAVLNAVCSELTADIVEGGRTAQLRFAAGELLQETAPQPSAGPDCTQIRFRLDAGVLPDARPGANALQEAVTTLRRRLPRLRIELQIDG
ncbi:hypothetical protein [Tahibacter caeni]|uniref:hypothetical protein n=1 Tax=Tahibacter caeni TaxID=1453545 RepID=UPI00214947E5|nr:hypothetical protein [Tahibacter caeni]